MLASLAFYLFVSTFLITSIKHEHSCVLYLETGLVQKFHLPIKPAMGEHLVCRLLVIVAENRQLGIIFWG